MVLGQKLVYCGQTTIVRSKVLSGLPCLQNFHLIDYNMLAFTVIVLARRLIAAIVKEVRSVFNLLCFQSRSYSGHFKTQKIWASEVSHFPFLMSLFSFLGITEWEVVVSSFDLSSDGPVCRVNADRLEPLPLPHLSLQDLFGPQPSLPLLPVNIRRKNP